jgi:hypothetical protein
VARPRGGRAPLGCRARGSEDGRGGCPAGLREIEVKYRLFDLAGLERALAERGASLSPPFRHEDQAYAPVGWAYGQPNTGVAFARLRTQNGHAVAS